MVGVRDNRPVNMLIFRNCRILYNKKQQCAKIIDGENSMYITDIVSIHIRNDIKKVFIDAAQCTSYIFDIL